MKYYNCFKFFKNFKKKFFFLPFLLLFKNNKKMTLKDQIQTENKKIKIKKSINFLDQIFSIKVFSGKKKRTTYIAVLRSGETKRISLETFIELKNFMKCDIIEVNKDENLFSVIKERLKHADILYWTPHKECWGIKYVDNKCIKFLIFKSKTFNDIKRFYQHLNPSQVFLFNRSFARIIVKESRYLINKTTQKLIVSESKFSNGLNTCIPIHFIKYEGKNPKLCEKNYTEFENFCFSNIYK